jgi:hypothetical protein
MHNRALLYNRIALVILITLLVLFDYNQEVKAFDNEKKMNITITLTRTQFLMSQSIDLTLAIENVSKQDIQIRDPSVNN